MPTPSPRVIVVLSSLLCCARCSLAHKRAHEEASAPSDRLPALPSIRLCPCRTSPSSPPMDGPIPSLLTALAADPYLVTASTAPQALMAEVLDAAGLKKPRPIQVSLVHLPRLAVDYGRLLALTEPLRVYPPPLFPSRRRRVLRETPPDVHGASFCSTSSNRLSY